MATTSPDPKTVDAPPAAPQNAAAPTGTPLPKSVGEVPVQQPAVTAPQGGQPPQPRDAVVPSPAEFGHPAPASSPDPRPQAEGHPQSLLRDGVPATSSGRASSPSPLPGTPEGGARAAIPGETAPTSRETQGRLAEPPPPAGIESQTIPIIKEQLTTLTTGVFTWFGQAWPGQDMEWKVEEREAEGGKGERSWLTEVAVELPSLGAVRATLRAGKEGIGVTLVAEDGRTAEILAAGQNGLEERFGAAGLRLGGFTVRDGSQ